MEKQDETAMQKSDFRLATPSSATPKKARLNLAQQSHGFTRSIPTLPYLNLVQIQFKSGSNLSRRA